MEVERFDELVRSLPDGASRRRVLAAALGMGSGLLGQRLETTGHDARKACKGKTGDKKRKCLKKAQKHNARHECLDDGDCADRATSCQGGSCQLVCPAGACPGCTGCVANLRSEVDRARVCVNQFTQVAPDSCATDADCTGNANDVCIRISSGPCTQSPCGLCAAPINVCVQ